MQSTGETISTTVKNLLAIQVSEDRDALAEATIRQVYSRKLRELAGHLGVSYEYLPRKMDAGRWDSKEIDLLASFFGVFPMDFVPGPGDETSE